MITIAFIALHLANRDYDALLRGDDSVKGEAHVCDYSEDVAGPGEWIAPDQWKPLNQACEYEFYTNVEIGYCLSKQYHKIAFFGDSLLLNIFFDLTRRLEDAGYGTLKPKPKDFYTPGGHMEFIFNVTSSIAHLGQTTNDDRRLVFWWTPSAFHADVRRYEKDFDALDVAIFGMATWNMGTYFQGANAFYDKYLSIIGDASGRGGVQTIVFGLHQLWPQRCKDPLGPCAKCNSEGKARAFREAVSRVAACAAPSSSGNGGAIFVDTLSFTNTPKAMADGDDAVHYFRNTTSMEATHLANVLCRNDGFARRQKREYECSEDVVDFDAMLSSEEAKSCVRR